MSALEVFAFPATGTEVRAIVGDDGEPRVVLADVCAALELSNARVVAARLDEDEVSQAYVTDSMGRQQLAHVVTEAGLYAVILRSDKPKAREFRRWVTHDVLPSIRKTGSYEIDLERDPIEAFERVLTVAKRERAARELAEAQVRELEPSAKAWDTLASADGDFSVADAAKVLSRDPSIKLGRDRLFTLLRDYGWIYRQRSDGRWRVKQTAVETGRLSELPSSHYHPRTGELVIDPPQVRVTAKGLGELHRRLGGTSTLPELAPAPEGSAV